MKKLITMLGITFALVLAVGTISAFAFSAVPTQQNLKVNDEVVTCEIYNIDGYNYFKLRDMAMLLNETDSSFSVDWDATQRTISIKTGADYVPVGGELEKGIDKSSTAVKSTQKILINGEPVEDLSVYNIGGNNYFKLRDLGKALRFIVDYDKESKTMLVKSYTKAESYEINAESGDWTLFENTIYSEDLIVKGDNAKVYFKNCIFDGNVVNEGSGKTMIYIADGCILGEESKLTIKNSIKEADFIESPFPKFFFEGEGLDVICDECYGATAGYGKVTLNGQVYTDADVDYFFDTINNTCVPYDGQKFSFLMACQAWEKGEKKVVIFGILDQE